VVFALCVVVALAAAGCDKLANCKSCKDDTHCKTCKVGWNLDENEICRLDCAKKFGSECPSCTEEKCICPFEYVWNGEKCVKEVYCGETDGAACPYCGRGFDLIDVNRKCSTCKDAFGEGCEACSETKCTTAMENYTISGAVAVKADCGSNCPSTCAALFPGCTQCDSESTPTKCVACVETAELSDGFCKYTVPKCTNGTKWMTPGGEVKCGLCTDFDEKCMFCNTGRCTRCNPGYALTGEGKCVLCGELFTDCLLCSADECTSCSASRIKTVNGCLNQNPFVEEPEESNAGMIAGIVIAVIVLVALIILAIYCFITTRAKKGKIDPSLYEDEFEFKSQSVL